MAFVLSLFQESEMLSNGQVQHGLRPGTACAPSFLYILKSAHFRFATLVMLAIITCFAFRYEIVSCVYVCVCVCVCVCLQGRRGNEQSFAQHPPCLFLRVTHILSCHPSAHVHPVWNSQKPPFFMRSPNPDVEAADSCMCTLVCCGTIMQRFMSALFLMRM